MGGSFISDENDENQSRKAPKMETIAITAVMAILPFHTYAYLRMLLDSCFAERSAMLASTPSTGISSG